MAALDTRYSLIVVASMPPPIAGQSMATVVLRDALESDGIANEIVDLSRPFYLGNRAASLVRRALQSALLPLEAERAFRRLSGEPIVYLQLGQSTQAMIRDVPILIWANMRRLPVVLHVHGGSFRRAFDRAPRSVRRVLAPLVAGSRAIIVLSPSLGPMFRGLIDPARVHVVANAPDAALTKVATRHPRRRLRAPLTVLYLSNLIKEKGYLTVLEAARMSAAAGRSHRFVLAGAVTEWTSVHPDTFIKEEELENVRYVGVATGAAKHALLAAADVFVLPTALSEGQPISILEAMQFGLPIIATPSGGIVDVIEDGLHGALIPPDSPDAIVATLDAWSAGSTAYGEMSQRVRLDGLCYTASRHGSEMIAVFDAVHGERLNERTPIG